MKNFFKAAVIAFIMLILFAYLAQALFTTVIFLGDTVVEPVLGLGILILFVLAACVVSFLFVFGLISIVAFVVICLAVSLLLSGLSILWPFMLVAAIIWLLVRDKKQVA